MSLTNSKFTVIITTYKRPEGVMKSIASVIHQTNTSWQLYVVIDDVITDYSAVTEAYKNNNLVQIIQNDSNIGKNASLNVVLNKLQATNYEGYLIYLDDDDWLADDCLSDFNQAINILHEPGWLVSSRTNHTSNVPFTKTQPSINVYNYNKDVLLLKRFSGDATHCINFKLTHLCRFPLYIKNAEEWIYFSQVSQKTDFHFIPKTGTFSDGYNPEGLTRNHVNNFTIYRKIIKDIFHNRLFAVYVGLYLVGRLVKILLASLFGHRHITRS